MSMRMPQATSNAGVSCSKGFMHSFCLGSLLG